MGPLSYMRTAVDRKVVMWRIPAFGFGIIAVCYH